MNVPEFEVMVFSKGLFSNVCCQKNKIIWLGLLIRRLYGIVLVINKMLFIWVQVFFLSLFKFLKGAKNNIFIIYFGVNLCSVFVKSSHFCVKIVL